MTQCPCGIARLDCTYHKPDQPEYTTLRSQSGGRASGRTTRQLLALPQNGWFFCKSLQDAQNKDALARAINRTDIQMKDVNELRHYYRFYGYWISGFDIDHAAVEEGLDAEILDGINKIKCCLMP